MTNNFSLEPDVKSELLKQITHLKSICERNQIPFFVSALIEDNGEESTYKSEILSPADVQLKLTNDRITQHLNVALGLYDEKYEAVFNGSYEEFLENM